ncbi:MAG: LysE family translocator [Planctomycetia bacterium]
MSGDLSHIEGGTMPLTTDQLLEFLIASALITLAPGPDVLATLGLGLSKGWKVAVRFGAGCGIGCLFHTSLAVLGVSAAIKTAPTAYATLKLFGACYLAWLGFCQLRSRTSASVSAPMNLPGSEQASRQGYFLKGLIANAVNPKVALFFLAFLPPFVDESSGNSELQLALLGILFTLVAVFLFGLIGFFSGQISHLLKTRQNLALWLDRVSGAIFLWLALLMLLPEG